MVCDETIMNDLFYWVSTLEVSQICRVGDLAFYLCAARIIIISKSQIGPKLTFINFPTLCFIGRRNYRDWKFCKIGVYYYVERNFRKLDDLCVNDPCLLRLWHCHYACHFSINIYSIWFRVDRQGRRASTATYIKSLRFQSFRTVKRIFIRCVMDRKWNTSPTFSISWFVMELVTFNIALGLYLCCLFIRIDASGLVLRVCSKIIWRRSNQLTVGTCPHDPVCMVRQFKGEKQAINWLDRWPVTRIYTETCLRHQSFTMKLSDIKQNIVPHHSLI